MKKLFFIIISFFYYHTSFCNYYQLDTKPPDTIRNIVYIYDTVHTEKIVYLYDTVRIPDTTKPPVENLLPAKLTTSSIIPPLKNESILIPRYFNFYTGSIFQTNFYSNNSDFKYKTSERPLPGISFGLSFSQLYSNKFNISMGMEYMSLHEKVNYPSSSRIDTNLLYNITYHDNWVNDTIGQFYFIRSGTDTVWNYITNYTNHPYTDSIEAITYDTINIRQNYSNNNSIIYLNIPISFGWNLKLSQKTEISIQTGVVISLLYRSKGFILSTTNQGEYISLTTPPLAQIMMNYQLGVAYKYRLHSGISFYFQPLINYTLNSIYSDSYSLSKKQLSGIIRVGVSIPINK